MGFSPVMQEVLFSKRGNSNYQGPGDIVSGAIRWGSCARAYNVAYANGTNPLCDLVAVTGGAVVCTLRVAISGFVDQTGSYCAGTTPAAACAAASGGSCKVTVIYDQTSHNNQQQVTLAAMPALTFNALGVLPCFTSAAAQELSDTTGAALTQTQPFTHTAVSDRTGGTAGNSRITSISGGSVSFGYRTGVNLAGIVAGSTLTATVSDSAFHGLVGVFNNTSSSLVVDGVATSGTAGATGYSANTFSVLADGGGTSSSLTGVVCEFGLWPTGFSATQYGNMNTNMHSATSGYNF